MDWYKRYIGDYQRDTNQLTPVEHGVYCLLLDQYYALERPLPSDPRVADHVTRAGTKSERRAVREVLRRFFPVSQSDGLRHNVRADEEIEKLQASAAQTVAAGRKGAEARWAKKRHGDPNGAGNGDPNGDPMSSAMPSAIGETMASQTPDSRLQKEELSSSLERSNPGRDLAARMTLGRNGKQKARPEDLEEDRVKRALVLLEGDPKCTEHEAARMFRVSVEAIQKARAHERH